MRPSCSVSGMGLSHDQMIPKSQCCSGAVPVGEMKILCQSLQHEDPVLFFFLTLGLHVTCWAP